MYRQRVPNFMNSNRTPQNSTVNGDNNVDKSKVETCGDNAIWWDRPEITQWKNTGVGHRRVLYYENQQRVTPEAVYSRQQMQTAIQFTTNAAYMTSKLDPILALRTVKVIKHYASIVDVV
ncbi:hypothetical protein R5R35_013062 [Gryllus longicercus]|uniref:Uncharacterized protein n=1 Tax=Gryllus longicercus TaxID=2509291 RepID=A0AAN9YZ19_9ORTH